MVLQVNRDHIPGAYRFIVMQIVTEDWPNNGNDNIELLTADISTDDYIPT